MRHPLALTLSAVVAVALLPAAPAEASTTVDDLTSTFADVRGNLATIRARTFPTTDDALETALEDVRDELEAARDDLEDLGGTSAVDDEEADRALAEAWLAYEDGWETLEWYAAQLSTDVIDTYEADAPDVVEVLADIRDAVNGRLAVSAGASTFCPTRKIGSTTEDVDRASAVLDGLGSVLEDLADDASELATDDDVALVRWRVEQIGTIADARLLALWRLSGDAIETLADSVDEFEDQLADLATAVEGEVGTSLALPVSDEVDRWVALLDEHVDHWEDEDATDFGSDWDDAREEHADVLVTRLGALRDRAEDAASDAETTWSMDEYVRIRREAAFAESAALLYRLAYRLPVTQNEHRDVNELVDDVRGAAQDTQDNLDDHVPSGWDEGDAADENGERVGVSSPLLLTRNAAWQAIPLVSDLPEDESLRQAVLNVVASRIASGDGMYFRPYYSVTRAEFMKMVARAACLEPGIRGSEDLLTDRLAGYVDVTSAHTVGDLGGYLALALDRSIIRGVDSAHLAPDRPVTRFEAAKILVEVFGVEGASSVGFIDVPAGEVATYVGRAVAAGFFNPPVGPGARFRPNDALSRAEAAKIIQNAVLRSGVGCTTLADESITVPVEVFSM